MSLELDGGSLGRMPNALESGAWKAFNRSAILPGSPLSPVLLGMLQEHADQFVAQELAPEFTITDDQIANLRRGQQYHFSLFPPQRKSLSIEEVEKTRENLHLPSEGKEFILQAVLGRHMEEVLAPLRSSSRRDTQAKDALKLIEDYCYKGKFLSIKELDRLRSWNNNTMQEQTPGMQAFVEQLLANETPDEEQKYIMKLSRIYDFGPNTKAGEHPLTGEELQLLNSWRVHKWPEFKKQTPVRAGKAMEKAYIADLAAASGCSEANVTRMWDQLRCDTVMGRPSRVSLLHLPDEDSKLLSLAGIDFGYGQDQHLQDTIERIDYMNAERWALVLGLLAADEAGNSKQARWRGQATYSLSHRWKAATRDLEKQIRLMLHIPHAKEITKAAWQRVFEAHSLDTVFACDESKNIEEARRFIRVTEQR